MLLKSSRNKKDLNNITVAPFLVGFFAAGSWEKNIENGAAVTSLRSFLFHDDFPIEKLGGKKLKMWHFSTISQF